MTLPVVSNMGVAKIRSTWISARKETNTYTGVYAYACAYVPCFGPIQSITHYILLITPLPGTHYDRTKLQRLAL